MELVQVHHTGVVLAIHDPLHRDLCRAVTLSAPLSTACHPLTCASTPQREPTGSLAHVRLSMQALLCLPLQLWVLYDAHSTYHMGYQLPGVTQLSGLPSWSCHAWDPNRRPGIPLTQAPNKQVLC
jgi:hypothetical protein